MDYLFWNKKIWNYFFKEELKNTSYKIVLAVNEDVINKIGFENGIENPIQDFIEAINHGPIEVDGNNVDKFSLTKKNYDFLVKAFTYIKEPDYATNYRGRSSNIKRWLIDNHDDCLITAYLAYLVLVISSEENEDDNTYWTRVNQNLIVPTSGNSQGYVPELFSYMLKWAKEKGFNFYYKNIYTRKKNVGTIYSQLPLTKNEENQIVASLFSLKKEDPTEFTIIKKSLNFHWIEDFIENMRPFLNAITAKELDNYSGDLRSIMLTYIFQNFPEYLEKAEKIEQEEFEKIIQTRKSKKENLDLKYFLSIEDNTVTGTLLVNIKSNLRSRELVIKSTSNQFSCKLSDQINDNKNETYYIYFFEDTLKKGTYSIFENGLNTEIQFKVTDELTDGKLKFPLWYKAFSRNEPNKLKILDVDSNIKFDINNPHNIICQLGYDFNQKEISNYGIRLLGENFKIKIGRQILTIKIYSLSFSEFDNNFSFANKKIQIIDKEFEINFKGAPDGRRGMTSFLENSPLKICFNPILVSKIKVNGLKNDFKQEISEFNQVNETFETVYSWSLKLAEGEYSVEGYNHNGNIIISKFFTISKDFSSEQRDEKYLDFKVCDFSKHSISNYYETKDSDCRIVFKKELIEDLIDILIRGRKISSIYDKDFKFIFESLVEKYHPELISEKSQSIELLQISKRILYLLDNLNILEREVHYIKTLIKPYWVESSIDRRYNLVGAISNEEINELTKITSVKSTQQVVYRLVNKEKVGFELPRQFYVEKCDEKAIPLNKKWRLYRATKNFDFTIPEQTPISYNGESVLEFFISNIRYFIPISNLHVLNWFTLQYEKINKMEFDELVSFFGFKLFKIQSEKTYNNRIIEHYFLFTINQEGVSYIYFPYQNRHNALRTYLKLVQNFDLSLILLRLSDDEKCELYKHLRYSNSTYKKYFENPEQNINQIKKIINRLDILDIGTSNGKFFSVIKNHFVFDAERNLFGINNSLLIPSQLEKYLISLSGVLPIFKIFPFESPNLNLKEIISGDYFKRSDTVFKIYFEIPEDIAFTIANSIIERTVYPVPGATSKPYLTSSITI